MALIPYIDYTRCMAGYATPRPVLELSTSNRVLFMLPIIKLRADSIDPPPIKLRDFWRRNGTAILTGLILAAIVALVIYRHDILFRLTGKFPDINLDDIAATVRDAGNAGSL